MLKPYKFTGCLSLFVVVLLVCAPQIPSMLHAQEWEDEVGIYFDQEGITTSIQTTEYWEYVEAWLILKNISAESGLYGIGVFGDIVGQIDGVCWMSLIAPQFNYCYPEWYLAAVPPIPQTDIIVTVLMWFWVYSPSEPVFLYVQPPDPNPSYYDGTHAI